MAFGHQSRVGKNTAAEAVRVGLGAQGVSVKVVSFAALLKWQAHELWGHHGLEDGSFYEDLKGPGPGLRDTLLPEINKTPVQLWIEYGQAVRTVYGPSWADACLAQRRPDRLLVISDLRFDNEGDLIHEYGGWCVKIEREGCPVKGSDEMIRKNFVWDATIENNGDITALQAAAWGVARAYLSRKFDWQPGS